MLLYSHRIWEDILTLFQIAFFFKNQRLFNEVETNA